MAASKLNWNMWLKNGDQYFKAAMPKGTPTRFGPVVVYNLLSMSLESYIMAIMDYHGQLPENHTYTDLIRALETVVPIAPSLKTRILQHENIQAICSIEKYQRSDPTAEELSDLREAIVDVGMIAHDICISQDQSPDLLS